MLNLFFLDNVCRKSRRLSKHSRSGLSSCRNSSIRFKKITRGMVKRDGVLQGQEVWLMLMQRMVHTLSTL